MAVNALLTRGSMPWFAETRRPHVPVGDRRGADARLSKEPLRHGFIGKVLGDGGEGIGECQLEVREESTVRRQGMAERAAEVGR